jgi:hypothetical protein
MRSARSAFVFALLAVATFAVAPRQAHAQGADTARVAPAADTTPKPKRVAPLIQGPPISAGRAFLYSFAVPGLGQAKLDRPTYGAVFFLLEITSIAMANRTASDVRTARAFQADSVPLTYKVDATTGAYQLGSTGLPIVDTWKVTPYPRELVKARRLQYEDWMAILIFNHLFSGADAFVAAQLWDLPQRISFRAVPLQSGATGYGLNLNFR